MRELQAVPDGQMETQLRSLPAPNFRCLGNKCRRHSYEAQRRTEEGKGADKRTPNHLPQTLCASTHTTILVLRACGIVPY